MSGATVYHVDGSVEKIGLSKGQTHFSLEELQHMVDGYIQILVSTDDVQLVRFSDGKTLNDCHVLCNENGRELGMKRNGYIGYPQFPDFDPVGPVAVVDIGCVI